MKNYPYQCASLLITVWAGSLWAIGYLAVPVLFRAQADKQLAGKLAGEMFAANAYLGLACGALLLLYAAWRWRNTVLRQRFFWLTAAMIAFTLLFQGYFQPEMNLLKLQALPLDVMHSAFADRFKMLHGIASMVYLFESLLAALLVFSHYAKPDDTL